MGQALQSGKTATSPNLTKSLTTNFYLAEVCGNKLKAGLQQQQLLFGKALKEAEAAIEDAHHSAKKKKKKQQKSSQMKILLKWWDL